MGKGDDRVGYSAHREVMRLGEKPGQSIDKDREKGLTSAAEG